MTVGALFNPRIIASSSLRFLRRVQAIHFVIILTTILFLLAIIIRLIGVLEFDVGVTRAVQVLRNPFLDSVFRFFTFLGDGPSFTVLTVAAGVYFWKIKAPKSAVMVLVSLSAYPINIFLKDWVERIRPTSDLVKIIVPAGGYSFPSGHAMITAAVYGFIAYLLWTQLKTPVRNWLAGTIAALTLLIGFSRVYLGVHWFTDVLGGWIAGVILILLYAEMHKKWVEVTKPAES